MLRVQFTLVAVTSTAARTTITLEPISLQETGNIYRLTSECYPLALELDGDFFMHDPLNVFMSQSLENDHKWPLSHQDFRSIGYRTSLENRRLSHKGC